MNDQKVPTTEISTVNLSKIRQLNMCSYDNGYIVNNLAKLLPKVRQTKTWTAGNAVE